MAEKKGNRLRIKVGQTCVTRFYNFNRFNIAPRFARLASWTQGKTRANIGVEFVRVVWQR